jgi:asparagine synthase (glutamine-hydrolysing)
MGTRHEELPLAGGFLEGLEDAVAGMDQPMALTSAVSLFRLARLARSKVKVILSGDGGDEVFGGYQRHRPYPAPFPHLAWIPRAAWPGLGAALRHAIPGGLARRSPILGKMKLVGSRLERDEAGLYTPTLFIRSREEALSLIPAGYRRDVNTNRYIDRVRRLFSDCPFEDWLRRQLYVDLRSSLADEMLAKVDRMTMAVGLEARVPLLDHLFLEAALRIPGHLLRDGETRKLPLRVLAGRTLGRDTAERPKSGFNSPLARWLSQRREDPEQTQALTDHIKGCSLLAKESGAGVLEDPGPGGRKAFSMFVLSLWARQRDIRIA